MSEGPSRNRRLPFNEVICRGDKPAAVLFGLLQHDRKPLDISEHLAIFEGKQQWIRSFSVLPIVTK